MDIGVGLDASLGLSFDQQGEASQAAARMGYTSVWTPENVAHDSFQLCPSAGEPPAKWCPRA
ncbi:MAG: hypothetical protein ACE5Q6_04910 [Dehalococcoidia bacterium]